MNAVRAIVRANLRRFVADRSNWFFVVVLPLLIVFALGTAIGQSGTDVIVGVVDRDPTEDSRSVRRLIDQVDGVRVDEVGSAQELRRRVARGAMNAGWVVRVADGVTRIEWVSGTDTRGIAMRSSMEQAVRAVASKQRVIEAVSARFDVTVDRATQVVAGLRSEGLVRVETSLQDPQDATDSDSVRAVLAGGQLSLFIFLTSLFGAAALLTSRMYGVTRRTRAAPVSAAAIIVGEAISRYLVALMQAVIIIAGTIVLFGVDWRSPLALALLCGSMALVGTGVAMLLGALGRSEQQVGALALLVGLVLAALGGSMQPLEFFPPGMRTVAFAVTPHAWMNDSLWKILVEGEGVSAALPAVAVLSGVGLLLLMVAAAVLRRTFR